MDVASVLSLICPSWIESNSGDLLAVRTLFAVVLLIGTFFAKEAMQRLISMRRQVQVPLEWHTRRFPLVQALFRTPTVITKQPMFVHTWIVFLALMCLTVLGFGVKHRVDDWMARRRRRSMVKDLKKLLPGRRATISALVPFLSSLALIASLVFFDSDLREKLLSALPNFVSSHLTTSGLQAAAADDAVQEDATTTTAMTTSSLLSSPTQSWTPATPKAPEEMDASASSPSQTAPWLAMLDTLISVCSICITFGALTAFLLRNPYAKRTKRMECNPTKRKRASTAGHTRNQQLASPSPPPPPPPPQQTTHS